MRNRRSLNSQSRSVKYVDALCEEGNLLSAAGFVLNFGFVKYVDTVMRTGIALSAFLFLRLISHRLGCPFDSRGIPQIEMLDRRQLVVKLVDERNARGDIQFNDGFF